MMFRNQSLYDFLHDVRTKKESEEKIQVWLAEVAEVKIIEDRDRSFFGFMKGPKSVWIYCRLTSPLKFSNGQESDKIIILDKDFTALQGFEYFLVSDVLRLNVVPGDILIIGDRISEKNPTDFIDADLVLSTKMVWMVSEMYATAFKTSSFGSFELSKAELNNLVDVVIDKFFELVRSQIVRSHLSAFADQVRENNLKKGKEKKED